MLFRLRRSKALRALSTAWVAASVAVTAAVEFDGELEEVSYSDVNDPDFALKGFMSEPEGDSDGPLPAVVILPDWDNVDDYEMMRADMIAKELGYIGFTADIYGVEVGSPQDMQVKMQQAGLYRSDPALFNSRIQSAIEVVRSDQRVDPDRVALIGYCLGGTGVMTYSFANTDPATSDIVAAVSFHGGLMEFPVKGEMANPLLVLSGGDDDTGTDVEALEATLERANATWQITRYSGIQHGFTKFGGPAYDEWVDERSWMEMSTFLREAFGEAAYGTAEPTEGTDYAVVADDGAAPDGAVAVQVVNYDHDGFALEGYLAVPPDVEGGEARPAVVFLPDWDGVNGPTGYEAGRAVLAAREGGYVAMVADIYGADHTDVEDMAERGELATKYRSDPALFVGRIQAGIDQVLAHPAVDADNIFVAGYCFGGTGAVDYGFSAGALKNVKAVVPLHGGLTPLRAVQTDAVQPYVLILSGGVDDAHGNPTELEAHLDGASAKWEISRYSNAQHGFTKWGSGRYDAMADSRSWWAMMSLFETFSEEATGDGPTQNIVEIASANDNFSLLAQAVVAAGLADALAGDGPFTAFAPTDAALEALGTDALQSLLADPERIAEILKYHVVSGKVMAADVETGAVPTLNGADINIVVGDDGSVAVNGVPVVATDIEASNGVIHAIDAVLLPPDDGSAPADGPTQNIAEILSADFSLTVQGVTAAGLLDALAGDGPFTMFAPNNPGVEALGLDALQALLNAPDELAELMKYHLVSGKVMAADIVTGALPTLNGAEIRVVVGDDGSVRVNDALVLTTDIEATNGVIHMIDKIIFPPDDEEGPAPADEPSPAAPDAPVPADDPVPAPTPDVEAPNVEAPKDDSAAALARIGIAAAAAAVLTFAV